MYFNIAQIKKHLHKFNGKKIININYENLCQAESFIKENFIEDYKISFSYTKNEQGEFSEVRPFIDKLIPSVYSLNENEYTFYAHTKGVTRFRSKDNFISLLWAYTMYDKNLNDFNFISKILEKYSCCGCLKLNKPYTCLSFVPWHYSGAFFWFNNKKLFSKNWQNIKPVMHGLEGYMATHFTSEEAHSIEPSLPDGFEDTYNPEHWVNFYRG